MTEPLIAIVGRPNVGKSTLYNRLIGGRPALVHDTPGLTRDRRYGRFEYFGHELRVVDTGGLDPEAEKDVIGAGIHRQARAAMEEADIVLFVVDATAGITPLDHEVATMLRKLDKPLLVCANKIDHTKHESMTGEIFALGLGEVYPVSAVHGRGIGDLLDAVVERLGLPPPVPEDDEDEDAPYADEEAEEPGEGEEGESGEGEGEGEAEPAAWTDVAAERGPLRVALVGKPNAGKSSLMNRLVGSERSLVHHAPGTTTDPVDTPFELGGTPYVLVDTAGIRRRARVEAEIEKLAVIMALSQIERADVVVLVIDAGEGLSEQDARLAGMVEEHGRALVVALNKVDTLPGAGAGRTIVRQAQEALHFMPYAPIALISALRGDGVAELMATVDRVAGQHAQRVSTAALNRFFAEVCETHPPPLHHGREVRIHYLTQGGVRPPTFLLWANRPMGVAPSYRRFLINQLRARYGFEGTPVRMIVKAKQQSRVRGRSGRRRPGRQ
jgi:GTP-binding protein